MDEIRKILQSDKKHKARVAEIVELAKDSPAAVKDLIDLLKSGTDVERGTSAEVFKFVSKENPKLVIKHLDTLIEYIDYKAPRVRWGAPESIGNLASKYPDKVTKAIPKLLGNTEDGSTVVRWCAAFALTEIAKHNSDTHEQLIPIFQDFIEKEQNNGVRNVYVKAMKVISS
jgi:HEAT repeat protein